MPEQQDHLFSECTSGSDNFTVNSSCSFSCERGFKLQGATSVQCTETGQWNTSIPICTGTGVLVQKSFFCLLFKNILVKSTVCYSGTMPGCLDSTKWHYALF